MGFAAKIANRVKKAGGDVASAVKDPVQAVQSAATPEGLRRAAQAVFTGGISEIPGVRDAFQGLTGGVPQVDTTLNQLDPSRAIEELRGSEVARFQAPQQISPAAIQAALINAGRFEEASRFAAGQAGLAESLQAQAAGRGPSLAEQLLRSEQDRLTNQQLALAATIGGRAAPTAQRQILQQSALGQQEALRQAAIARAQEQLSAQEQLANVLGTARGQDIQRSGLVADVEKANQAARQQATLETARQQFASQELAARQDLERQIAQEQADQARREAIAQAEAQERALQSQRDLAQLQARTAETGQQRQLLGGILGGAASAGTAAIGASDRTLKHDIKSVSRKDLNEFFKAIKPQSYKYKNRKWGEGDKIGFMMQDIEKTKLGKLISRPLSGGKKGYDPQGLQGILLAKFAMDSKKKGAK